MRHTTRIPLQRRSAPRLLACAALLAAIHLPASARSEAWEFGTVVDIGTVSRGLELGMRDQGLGFGHSDLVARGPIGRLFDAQASIAWHSHDGRVEAELHETWLQTRSLPGGFQLRAGRFLSQVGYLNEKHPHSDDFVERPLLYRAFLGNHWFDDGVRLNWTAPTATFLQLGAELFNGRQLIPETATSSRRMGIAVLSAKLGGDLGASHGWQIGASWMYNRRQAAAHDEHGHDEHGDDEHDHEDMDADHAHDHAGAHTHGAAFSGRRMWVIDAVWKWSPDGDGQRRQVRFVAEYARVSDPDPAAGPRDRHEAATLGVVWRFAPQWEIGARTDWLRVWMPGEDGSVIGSLREHAAMLAWKPTHSQALRLQVTTQRDANGFENPARHSVALQYVVGFGAHGAHAF